MADIPAVPDNGPEFQAPSPKVPRPHAELGPSFATAEPKVEDLSAQIARTVSKTAGERVTCRRISGNHYRCNWWSARGTGGYDNPEMTGQLVTTHRVVRSELLRVTRTGTELRMDPVSPAGTR
jgi:hypothetical protein